MSPNDAFPTDPLDKIPAANLPVDNLPFNHAQPVEAVPVAVEADDYEAFGLWMNIQLSQLVARWKHLAAPNATSPLARRDRNFGKPHKAK